MKHSGEYDQQELKAVIHAMTLQPVKGKDYQTSIAENFSKDYLDFVGEALGRSGNFTRHFPFLTVHILRGDLELPNGTLAEYAVLQSPSNGSYVVLRGERSKSDFAYGSGILGFMTKGGAPVTEVKAIFKLWDNAIAPLKKIHGGRHARMEAIRETFGRADYDVQAENFLDPLLHPSRPWNAASPQNGKPAP